MTKSPVRVNCGVNASTSKPSKPSLLLINCYRSVDDHRFPVYEEWLSPFFQIKTVHVDAFENPDVKEDSVVVSGSERLVSAEPLPQAFREMFLEVTKPLLGICYGHQALALAWGAKVVKKKLREGEETISLEASRNIFSDMGLFLTVHISHSEDVVKDGNLTKNFDILAYSNSCAVEAIGHKTRPLWGVQFHPERSGLAGRQLVRNFCRIVDPGAASLTI